VAPGIPGIEGLLDRDEEIAELAAVLAAARDGAIGIAVVEGEPGIGKSRLLDAAAHLARASGMRVLAARGLEFERDLAFGVAINLLEPVLDALSPAARGRVFRGAAAHAASLFDSGCASAGGDSSRFGRSLVRALRQLAGELAGDGDGHEPLLIAVDNVRWCDSATLRFLVQLCEGMRALPLAVVLAVRSDALKPAREILGAMLKSASTTRVLRPRPLSAEAVECMVREAFPDAEPGFAAVFGRLTGGNPCYMRALVERARKDRIPPTANGAPGVESLLPESVAESVLSRVTRLPAPAAALASAVAVLGDNASLRHAALLAAVSTESAAHAADALATAHILRPGEPLSFDCPLARAAVYAEMPALARSRAHREAARLLDADGAPAENAAAHLLACGPEGAPWAVETLREAARAAIARSRPQVARQMLIRAAAEPPPPGTRAEVVQELAAADAATGAPGAVERVREALTFAGPGRRAGLLRSLARLLVARSDFAAAAEASSQAFAELPDGDPRAAELAVEALAITGSAAAAPPPTATALLQEIAAGPDAASLPAIPGYLAQLAVQMLASGRTAAEVAATARAGLDHLPVDDGCHGFITGFAVTALISADDYAPVRDRAVALLDHAHTAGSLITVGLAGHWLSLVRYREGDLRGALEAGRQTLAAADVGWDVCRSMTAPILAYAHLHLGDPQAAAKVLPAESQCDAGRPDWSVVRAARADLALAAGRPHAALAELLEVGDLAARGGFEVMLIVPWRSAAATAAAAAGDRHLARDLAGAELARARAFGAPRRLGIALRVAGAVHGGEDGLAMAREAVAVLEHSPARLELARALVSLGTLLRRQGQRAASRDPLHRGLDLARELEAGPLAEYARHELSAAGGRRREPRARTGPAALTPTERGIAGLAAAGLSTPQIAGKLSIAAKTVDWHLGNTYRKLGIASRRELPAALNGRMAESGPGPGRPGPGARGRLMHQLPVRSRRRWSSCQPGSR
jgi:DNA-binding CsgD family transcriptional regulator